MTNPLPKAYVQVRDRIRIHSKQIRRRIPRKHPEYTVALLIAIASEILSSFQKKEGHWVFTTKILRQDGVSNPIGCTLFRALRHGLAHSYDTALINIRGRQLVLVVTWKKPQLHLTVKSGHWLGQGMRCEGIFLDVDTMWTNLETYWRKMNQALAKDRALAKKVTREARRVEQKYTVKVDDPEDVRAWLKFLAERTPRG